MVTLYLKQADEAISQISPDDRASKPLRAEWLSLQSTLVNVQGEAEQSAAVPVHVALPADALAGESDTVVITATSHNGLDLWDSATITTTAGPVYGVELTT